MAQEEEKKGVLAGVNFATVVASALAAGTSLTLATYIGIAGSVIGAVVAAAVSSIASQVYQGIISKSADKIKDVADAALTQVTTVAAPPPPSADETTVLGQDETGVLAAGDTVVRSRAVGDEPSAGSLPQTPTAPGPQTPIAPDELVSAAHEHESRDHRRRALTVSIVAALVALAITAAAIFALTAGEGIGAKPSFTPTYVEEEADDQDASAVDAGTVEEGQEEQVEEAAEAPAEEPAAESTPAEEPASPDAPEAMPTDDVANPSDGTEADTTGATGAETEAEATSDASA